ncbi:Bacteriophage/Gene transfer agent portal protein [uncultured Caudovirales phage]|uniref:Bacteriophage/Gene transfer agent portal protein n=1 Tax=uncultured Caudovirales phage TaxID=2100421 RepID=A0A6J5S2Z9_9CAUD|nr:Bacteriophage/Gene transfer agent portal protein [uncultured Caudovirales phage]CAB4199534.1 Bacteriophage/Gene transfer agent portal protein [uncultured Caudovirales phage]CAB5228332.1 Bacteriophage/Gene transfer agent portal protein [uncultured Caudovirales phage]
MGVAEAVTQFLASFSVMANRLTNVARAMAEGKALPAPPPADTYAAAGLPVGGETVPHTSRLSQREARRHMSSYGGEQAIDTVNNCINTYLDALTLAEWELKRDGVCYVAHLPKEAPPEVLEAPADLVSLLENPNPWQNWDNFMSLAVTDYLMIGNFYWLKFQTTQGSDKPLALYRLNPADVQVIPGKRDLIAGYEYRIPGRGQPVRFPADMVIHGMRPNPHNPYFGLGIVAAGARMLDVELALTETQAQFFEQGAKLSGVLQSDRRVPDPVFKKITMQFRNLYSGSKNAYKVAILEQGLQFKSIQPTAAESEFVALSNLSFERICRLFRIPPELLQGAPRPGIMQEAKRQFTSDTMAPLLKRMNNIISDALTEPGWDLEFFMDYKYVMPREDQLKLVAGIATLPGIRINEIREEAGLDPLPKNELGDDGKPIGDMIINLPMPSTEQPGGVADQPLPNEVGRPPKMENTMAFPQRGSGSKPNNLGNAAPPHKAALKTGKAGLEETISLLEEALSAAGEVPVTRRVDTDALTRNLELLVLSDGKSLGKQQRDQLVGMLDQVPEWSTVKKFAGDLATAVSEVLDEGTRRGYSPEQLWRGYGIEKFDGVLRVVSDWAFKHPADRV